jgi:beta-galactosidase
MNMNHKAHSLVLALLFGLPLAAGCGQSASAPPPIRGGSNGGGAGGSGAHTGGATGVAGQTAAEGGAGGSAAGGTSSGSMSVGGAEPGGALATGGVGGQGSGSPGGNTGGTVAFGGSNTSGGNTATSGGDTAVPGGTVAVSGGNTTAGGNTAAAGGTTSASGGITTVSGGNALGGTTIASGGNTTASGGDSTSGGNTASGGSTTASGGVTTSGGTSPTGGTGGTTSTGGTTIPTGRVRTIMPLDRNWLFNKGDATGADQTAFADSGWSPVNLPHDWSVEGPFSSTAPMTGRGGYLASGIAWYRNHFTLPSTVSSGQRVYVEFDGVMANSTVYVNGTAAGTHPYGYVSFRYDITANIKFGTTENVIAVKTDTSLQPASRYYAGAGIYRHARIIATDPVHVDQWATYVSTKGATAASATVHVTTSVVNSGTTSQSVSVQGIVSPPSGAALAPVTTAAQNIAAGASASFTFDVPVTNPKLWDLASPNMYSLQTNVLVGSTTVDDDVTPVGIRSLTFDGTTGMNLNGKNIKFQGVCLHQDYHGLGLAAPQRAMQRRLAQLKVFGVNAVRTAHDPPSPDFLDLCDRMGILVMDEFFDAWVAHKYSDNGDDAAFFSKTATSPTGMPAVPGTATAAPWYQVDVTGIVSRDRNHPSVALYSAGNEIRDSLATRTPILTKMVSICHALDPDRPVTQALFQPSNNNDINGATRTLLDVFGANYRTSEVTQAMGLAPKRAGLLTEMGTELTTWADVTGNPALTGEFMWTGVDYMGERDGGWPSFGGNGALMDEMGTPRTLAYSWQTTWGAPKTTPTGTGATAGKVTLTADHTTITTDVNDVSFVKAAVTTDTTITFAVAGPGTIIAVDSGSMVQESFRGNTRKTFGGLAFAIVRATGTGTITVTATATGLTDGTATVTATGGPFVPCSGTCD